VTGTGVTPTSGFVSYVRVRFNECDPLGHVNNAVYLNYLEQIAIDHAAVRGWTSSALIEQAGALFVARKHEIQYHRPAFEGDLLQVRTWPTEMRGARGYRVYDISRVDPAEDRAGLVDRLLEPDELVPLPKTNLIVTARTEWAFMSPTTGRPARIPATVAADFVSQPF
jgi:acyl-CoA thioester hydrolase